MNGSKASAGFKLFLKWLIPLAVSAISIYLLSRQISFSELAAAFKRIPLLPLLISFVFNILGMVLRAMAWQGMLGSNFDFRTSFFAMSAGYLLNNILPFRLGEIGRAALLTGEGKNKAPFMQVIASVVTERTLDIFIASALFLVTLPLVVSQNSLRVLAYIFLAVTTLLMVLGAIGAGKQEQVRSWLLRKEFFASEKGTAIVNKLIGFLEGFRIFLEPKKALSAFLLLFLSWLMAMAQLWYVQSPLIPESKLWWTSFVTSAGAFVNALPSAPGGLGVFEAGVVSAYKLLGADQTRSLAIALVMHATTFVFTSLAGLLGLSILGENLGSLFRKANQKRSAGETIS